MSNLRLPSMNAQQLEAWWPEADAVLAKRFRPAVGGAVAPRKFRDYSKVKQPTYSREQVRILHEDYGVEPELIAERFGISQAAVNRILGGSR